MFKRGDIIYCNGKKFSGDVNLDWDGGLTLNKPYTIIDVGKKSFYMFGNNHKSPYYYYKDRFISLKEYRKQKLNKIIYNK